MAGSRDQPVSDGPQLGCCGLHSYLGPGCLQEGNVVGRIPNRHHVLGIDLKVVTEPAQGTALVNIAGGDLAKPDE
jgi:hypothetical protein